MSDTVNPPVDSKVKGHVMRIGEIAVRAGVPAKTIRFWEDQRLLPAPARSPAQYRLYDVSTIERLAFIRHGQAAGLTLDQIRQVLDIGDSGNPPCQHVSELIDGRLAAVDARIAELEAARSHLRFLARRAAQQDPAECHSYCAILHPAPAPAGAAKGPRAGHRGTSTEGGRRVRHEAV